MANTEYDSLITIMTEIKAGLKDSLSDLKKSVCHIKKESSKTKESIVRIETKMENLVTKPESLEAMQEHCEEKHKSPSFFKSDYVKYSGTSVGASTVIYMLYQLVAYLNL